MHTELAGIATLVGRVADKIRVESQEWWFVVLGLVVLALLFHRHWRTIVALFAPLFLVDGAVSIYLHMLHGKIPINSEYQAVVAVGISFFALTLWAHRSRTTVRSPQRALEPTTSRSALKPEASPDNLVR